MFSLGTAWFWQMEGLLYNIDAYYACVFQAASVIV